MFRFHYHIEALRAVTKMLSNKGGGGEVLTEWWSAVFASLYKRLATVHMHACSNLQGTNMWEEKLVRLFGATSTNTHYTDCTVLLTTLKHFRMSESVRNAAADQ